MSENWFFICPIENQKQGTPLTRYVFGPYKNYEDARSEADRLGGEEPIPLPAKTNEEAVQILEGGR